MRRTVLAAGPIVVRLCAYAPGERHARHTDTFSRLSFLLRGAYHEEGKPGAIRMRSGDLLLKSYRAPHEDVFGEEGATLIAVEFVGDDPFDANGDPDCWRKRADAYALRHVASIIDAARAGDASAVRAAAHDVILDTSGRPSKDSAAPAWLKRLHAALEESSLAEIDVAATAEAAGVHPAHASRLFRRFYGASITEHAHANSIRRAIEPLASPHVPLSEVALCAGFYDQSHMTRVFRRLVGRTPGAHRVALTALRG